MTKLFLGSPFLPNTKFTALLKKESKGIPERDKILSSIQDRLATSTFAFKSSSSYMIWEEDMSTEEVIGALQRNID